jgi:Domain of unknown function (DUF4440)
MPRTTPVTATILLLGALLGCPTMPSLAQEARWGAPDDPTVTFVTAMEAKWASSACGPQPDLEAAIADDFQGTTTDGRRFGKAAALGAPKALARDCRLDDIKVRLFGDAIAIAYGSESRIRKSEDGAEARRCQVWTDTWLQRQGRWQIVAAQDTVTPCNP